MKIDVMVISHKQYPMPKDEMYLPVAVGDNASQLSGFVTDSTGENIAQLNDSFCELTGLYWGWKNLDTDYIGLMHYRRYLKGMHGKRGLDAILNQKEAEKLLHQTDILLPKARHYIIETVYSHYEHTHYGKDLRALRKVLQQQYPEYLSAFDEHMSRRSLHICNMFIMKKELADAYCEFLFPVLFALKEQLDTSEYDAYQARVYGRLSELLLDVWLDTNGYTYKELPMLSTEKINWWKKGTSFLKAKFFHEKYKESF